MSQAAANSFWSFSLQLYGKPGVASAFLGLQDRLGLDVNMLLLCCWAGAAGRQLSVDDLKAAERVAAPWQMEVVRQLRVLRRRLKRGYDGLPADRVDAYRKSLNALELEGEHIAQDAIANLFPVGVPAGASASTCTVSNLRAYLKLRHAPIDKAERADLTAILGACCPDVAADEITAAFA